MPLVFPETSAPLLDHLLPGEPARAISDETTGLFSSNGRSPTEEVVKLSMVDGKPLGVITKVRATPRSPGNPSEGFSVSVAPSVAAVGPNGLIFFQWTYFGGQIPDGSSLAAVSTTKGLDRHLSAVATSLPISATGDLTISPSGRYFLWTAAPMVDGGPDYAKSTIYDIDTLSSRVVRVSHLTFSPAAWDTGAPTYLAGYSSGRNDVYLARIDPLGLVHGPVLAVRLPAGCALEDVVALPGTSDFAATETQDLNASQRCGPTTREVAIDAVTATIQATLDVFPLGLYIDGVGFDPTGHWMVYSATPYAAETSNGNTASWDYLSIQGHNWTLDWPEGVAVFWPGS